MKTVSVGLIGAGFHARTVQLPAMDLVETIRLKAIATSRPATAEAASERYRVPGYADYRFLVENRDIEAVMANSRCMLSSRPIPLPPCACPVKKRAGKWRQATIVFR